MSRLDELRAKRSKLEAEYEDLDREIKKLEEVKPTENQKPVLYGVVDCIGDVNEATLDDSANLAQDIAAEMNDDGNYPPYYVYKCFRQDPGAVQPTFPYLLMNKDGDIIHRNMRWHQIVGQHKEAHEAGPHLAPYTICEVVPIAEDAQQ